MSFDAAWVAQITTQIRKQCAGLNCKACGSQRWTVGSPAGLVALDPELMPKVPVEIEPLLPVTCDRCGGMMLFSAKALDLKPKPAEPNASGASSGA